MNDLGDTDLERFDVASIASISDCTTLGDALTKEMADIQAQLDLADARRELMEPVDPIWYARAKAALKYRGRTHQLITRRRGELVRLSRQENARRRWEYLWVMRHEPSYRELNIYGVEGWELVGFDTSKFIFKREIAKE